MGTLNPLGTLNQPHARYPAKVAEDVGAARRSIGRLAATAAGLPAGDAEIVVTELATNILRHAGGDGYLLSRAGEGWLEVLAVDRGPGLAAGALAQQGIVPRAGGSLGIGLAAVRRYATGFDVYSSPAGTVILARLGSPPAASWDQVAAWGAVNVPFGGSGPSGDGWLVTAGPRLLGALVVDGLGHGPAAAAAAAAAIAAFERQPVTDPAAFIGQAHTAMHGTRGGVLAACVIDPVAGTLQHAGAGNISGWLLHNGTTQDLLSKEGTLGTHAHAPSPRRNQAAWRPGSTLVLASDGIRGPREPQRYRGLFGHDPSVAAAVLYRDHEKGTDDGCVLVVRDVRQA